MFYLSRSFGYLTVMCIRRRKRREALSSLINVSRFDTEQKDVIVQKRLKRREGKERLCGEGCGSWLLLACNLPRFGAMKTATAFMPVFSLSCSFFPLCWAFLGIPERKERRLRDRRGSTCVLWCYGVLALLFCVIFLWKRYMYSAKRLALLHVLGCNGLINCSFFFF